MNRKIACIVLASLCFGSIANAGFVNGGFETGDFTGWTLEHRLTYGGWTNYGSVGNGHQYVVPTQADPYSPFDSPFNGNYMARLNEWTSPYYDVSRISQTGIMGATETDVYINWGAVMEDPSHPPADEPFFDIEVLVNGVSFALEQHRADQGTAGGWTAGTPWGPNWSQIYYSSGTFHVGGLNPGDTVTVIMTAADCGWGGHVGYAYLDGIGTQIDPPNVPDTGSTALLLIPALFGLLGLRRRFC